MFGETLAPISIFGMALVVIAVAMVTWKMVTIAVMMVMIFNP
jgi:hypothetical protein